jgi:hypothetical protein
LKNRSTTSWSSRLVELTNKLAIGDPTERRSTGPGGQQELVPGFQEFTEELSQAGTS